MLPKGFCPVRFIVSPSEYAVRQMIGSSLLMIPDAVHLILQEDIHHYTIRPILPDLLSIPGDGGDSIVASG